MDLVISIKPKFLNKIREGSKIWELRKSLPIKLLEEDKINKVWVWETSPVSKIVGYFNVTYVSIGNVEQTRSLNSLFLTKDKNGEPILCKTNMGEIGGYYHNFGITKAEFDAYFRGCENKIIYALLITNWVEQSADFGIKPPQNYVFLCICE